MYPKDVGPQSQAELFAWVFGMLSSAWSMIAQYEALDRERAAEDDRRHIDEFWLQKNTTRAADEAGA